MTPATFRQRIADLGLNQTEAAKLMGVEPRTVRHWIAGTRKVPNIVEKFLDLYAFATLTLEAENVRLRRACETALNITELGGLKKTSAALRAALTPEDR